MPGSAALSVAYDELNVNVETAWIAPGDALLVYDANASGGFDDYSEIALTSWGYDQEVQTDLQALDAYFNLNNDGVFDSSDTAWTDFGVWTDLNLDAVQQEGEFTSLDVAGIESIGLDYNEGSQSYSAADGQAQIYGQLTVTYSDGTSGLAEDVAFSITPSESITLDQEDDATTESILGDESMLTTADLVDQFLESNPVEYSVVAEIQQDLINSENDAGMSDPDSTSDTSTMPVDAADEVHENDLDIEVEVVNIAMNDIVDSGSFDSGEDYSSGAV